MLKSFVRVALRRWKKNKSYVCINIVGLCLGIVSALAIFQIVRFELSFDTYHRDADRIYRVVQERNEFGQIKYLHGIAYPLPAALRLEFPQLETVTMVARDPDPIVIAVTRGGESRRFREDSGFAYADSDYFRLFTYQWRHGDPASALVAPNTVVVSEKLALKYFGRLDILGEILNLSDGSALKVTGVVADVPDNTDLPFNMLIAMDQESYDDNWGNNYGFLNCYVKLFPQVDPAQLESQFPDFLTKYRDPKDAEEFTYFLQPLNDLHFNKHFANYNRTVSHTTLAGLSLIAAGLILMACINFVNLSTAMALYRAKEVGVRKVMGSSRGKIMLQQLSETALIALAGFLVALAVSELILERIQDIIGYRLGFETILDPTILLFVFALFVVIGLGAGLVPAIYHARFTAMGSLRRHGLAPGESGVSLRRGLVVVQFAISQALILAALIVSGQTRYLQNVDMGFDKEAVVEVRLPNRDETRLARLKNELIRHNSILSASLSNTGTASDDDWGGDFELRSGEHLIEGNAQIKFVDRDFLGTYGIPLVAGDNFPQDSMAGFLVNEAFARENGFGSDISGLLGKPLEIWTRKGPILGVVRDFHTKSLHQPIRPVVLVAENIYMQAGIKLAMQDPAAELAAVRQAWSAAFPEGIFDYAFLDATIASFYEAELRTTNLVRFFTFIAVVIGCIGLFGLVSFATSRRTKEIGIRKVLGASAFAIYQMLARETIRLVVLSSAVAAPLTWLILRDWLQGFAYHIELGWPVFLLGFMAILGVAVMTVSSQALRAAWRNPVESLRYE